jgi:hypothetical protein
MRQSFGRIQKLRVNNMSNDRVERASPRLRCAAGLLVLAITGCPGDWQRWWPGDGDDDDDGEHGAAGSGNAGAGVAGSSGAGAEEKACGGLQGLRCDDGEFCNYSEDAQCGAADATGVCGAIPSVCTLELNPVCGCNSRTYSNRCSAAAEGVSVASDGECAEEYCGGYAGIKCSEDEYCDLAAGQGCGVADASGRCRPRPSVCTREYEPVCGCNDWTYDNACLAAAAGMTIRVEGDCGPVQ